MLMYAIFPATDLTPESALEFRAFPSRAAAGKYCREKSRTTGPLVVVPEGAPAYEAAETWAELNGRPEADPDDSNQQKETTMNPNENRRWCISDALLRLDRIAAEYRTAGDDALVAGNPILRDVYRALSIAAGAEYVALTVLYRRMTTNTTDNR